MALVVARFFEITGVSVTTPTNMAQLIPYLLTVFIALFLVSAVFGVIGALLKLLFGVWKR